MQTLKLDLPQDLVALLQGFNQPIEESARELMVLELYRRAVISSGKAAELMSMQRFEFIHYASRLGIAFFDMTEDEWEVEAKLVDTL
jgi:predicted HTH domain antitoxin